MRQKPAKVSRRSIRGKGSLRNEKLETDKVYPEEVGSRDEQSASGGDDNDEMAFCVSRRCSESSLLDASTWSLVGSSPRSAR